MYAPDAPVFHQTLPKEVPRPWGRLLAGIGVGYIAVCTLLFLKVKNYGTIDGETLPPGGVNCVAVESRNWRPVEDAAVKNFLADRLGVNSPATSRLMSGVARCDVPLTAEMLATGIAVTLPTATDCEAYEPAENNLPEQVGTTVVRVACSGVVGSYRPAGG